MLQFHSPLNVFHKCLSYKKGYPKNKPNIVFVCLLVWMREWMLFVNHALETIQSKANKQNCNHKKLFLVALKIEYQVNNKLYILTPKWFLITFQTKFEKQITKKFDSIDNIAKHQK